MAFVYKTKQTVTKSKNEITIETEIDSPRYPHRFLNFPHVCMQEIAKYMNSNCRVLGQNVAATRKIIKKTLDLRQVIPTHLIFACTVRESNRLIGQGTVGPAASVLEGPGN